MLKTSESEISKLYDEVINKTKNFRKFDLDYFIKNPKGLVVLRLILNLNLREFGKLVKCSFSYVSEWENGNKMPTYKTVKRVLSILKEEIINKNFKFNKNYVIDNFLYFKKMAKGTFLNEEVLTKAKNKWYKRMDKDKLQLNSIIGIKNNKRTLEEREIAEILKKEKINYEEQKAILDVGNEAGIIVTDFLINTGVGQFIIETSNFELEKFNRKGKKIIKSRAKLLAYRAFRINLYKPWICKIAAIKINYNYETLVKILNEAFNFVIVNDFQKIIEIIYKRRQQDLNLQVLSDTSFL